jgi:adenosylmethionine-8-amino-7-oxononanoate aminotransferase
MTDSNLWGHFSRLDTDLLSIERGDGCYVWDGEGNRYLDGLAGLFATQVGHGRPELATAAFDQTVQLAYFPLWGFTHPSAEALATRLASLAPGDVNRVFFTSGGSEAVESAWKLARQYFTLIGEPERTKVISRDLSYHGTSMGALSITGLDSIKTMFGPLVAGAIKVSSTDQYRKTCGHEGSCLCAADEIDDAIRREGPNTVAAVFLEPVQNAGGCLTPPDGYFQRVREICDAHGVLLVSDEVICAFGRLGSMFGADRYGYLPDMITTAKGITSGYAPLGALLVSERIAKPFEAGTVFQHGFTFAGHPAACAVALANLDILEGEDLPGHVRANEDEFRSSLETLAGHALVGDIRGAGYFWGIELVKDQTTKEPFNAEAGAELCAMITRRTRELGLICRATYRGAAVIQLSPPLIAGTDQFDEINAALDATLGGLA